MIDKCLIENCNFNARVKGFCLHCYEKVFYTYTKIDGKAYHLKNLVLDSETGEEL